MHKIVTRLLTPPKVADPRQARTARQLYYLLLLGIPITLIFLLLDEEVRAGVPRWNDLIAGGVGVVLIAMIPLLFRGYVRSAGILVVASCLSAIIMASFYNIGIRNPSMIAVPLMLMVCSVLLGSRTTMIFATIMALVVTGLYYYERSGVYYPQPPVAETNYYLALLLLIGMTTAILHLTISQILHSEQQVRRQAEELHMQNKRLAQTQMILETRSHQLSKLNADLQLEMSERSRTEAALRQKQKLESIGLLAGGIAHDFNNLLTSILNQSDMALRRINHDVQARQHVEKAIQSSQRAAELTRQLLAYAGKARFQMEALDLNRLIQSNSGLLETVLQHNSRLALELQPQLPAIVADRGQLQQVLMNLVINAAESITHDHGEITVQTRTISLTNELGSVTFVGAPPAVGDYVCLEIRDNGSGIEAQLLEKIFDPFFSTKEYGNGLGLSAVLGVVQSLRGSLQVQSSPHAGSAFRVYLPASPSETIQEDFIQAQTSQESASDLAIELLASTRLVLVIDDDDWVRETAVDMLTSLGYTTVSAPNGLDGLAIFQQHRNHIGTVLLDVVMPGISGLETVQRLRTLSDSVPVILCSGYSDTAIPDPILKHPATRFLAKPYMLEQLTRVMAMIEI